MGGDHAPRVNVQGALWTRSELGKRNVQELISKLGFWFSVRAFEDYKRILDYAEHWGALLLGIKGAGITCHGDSNSKVIKNAIRIAIDFVNNHVKERLEEGLAAFQTKRNER